MQLPGPLRAAVGLAATAAEEARHLPDRAIELPMLAVSTALQMSLRLQQRYARLTARGDAILTRRPAGDEPPQWATFDDPVSDPDLRDPDRGDSTARYTARSAETAGKLIEEVLGVDTPDNGAVDVGPTPTGVGPAGDDVTSATTAAGPDSKNNAPTANRANGATRTSAANRSSAARAAAKKSTKTVSKPRNGPASRFDSAPDGADD